MSAGAALLPNRSGQGGRPGLIELTFAIPTPAVLGSCMVPSPVVGSFHTTPKVLADSRRLPRTFARGRRALSNDAESAHDSLRLPVLSDAPGRAGRPRRGAHDLPALPATGAGAGRRSPRRRRNCRR